MLRFVATRSTLLALAAVTLVPTSACVVGPFNNDQLSTAQAAGTAPVAVTAFVPSEAATLTVTQSDGKSGDRTHVAATYPVTALDGTDVKGTKWFGLSSNVNYSENVTLSTQPEYWSVMTGVPVPGGTQSIMTTYLSITGTSSALGTNYPLYTFNGGSAAADNSKTQCLENAFDSQGGLDAIGACGGVQHSIALHLNCGAPGQACCPFACEGIQPIAFPCNNTADGSIYGCVNGSCQPLGGKCDVAGYPPCGEANCPGTGEGGVASGCEYPTTC